MATDSSSASEQLEEDVSLSDLPHNLIKPDQNEATVTKPDGAKLIEAEEEFDFASSMRGSSSLADEQMCAADELFFKGQILPLRLSISSDSGLTKPNPTRRLSGSESMDGHSISGFKSISDSKSSNCSSTRISPNSSRSNSNSSSSTATTNTSIVNSKPRVRNQFYTQPSPKPQIQISNGARLEKVGSRRSHKSSSIWDFFRFGLVRAPDQVLRSNSARVSSNRISVSRNSSVNSNNSANLTTTNTGTVANSTISDRDKNNADTNTTTANLNASENLKQKRQGFFSGCKCSFEAVASSAVVPKSNVVKESEAATHEKKADKVAAYELKMKKMKKKKSGSKQKQQKQDMSHHRTYEWLKGL